MLDILKYSINTGMAEIGTLTGADILSKYVRDYGFGSETGIELPGEGAGILYNPEDMSKLDVQPCLSVKVLRLHHYKWFAPLVHFLMVGL